jgi:RNA polymerase sigma factor (sigma-70 family)
VDDLEVTDGELWNRAYDDGRAFGILFERHAKAVYNHCFRRTGSWSRAEDLTSIVFLEAWRRRRDVRLHTDTILPWLLAVANKVLLNYSRSMRRYHRLLIKLPRTSFDSGLEDDVGNRIDDERAMKVILAELSHLRNEEQEVIALCNWAGLTYAEAATALGIPIGTVRSRLSRAHDHLRIRMNSESDETTRSIAYHRMNSPKEEI